MKTLLTTAVIFCGSFTAVISGLAQTWTPTGAPNIGWGSVAVSADGSKLAALSQPNVNVVWVSTNAGLNWTSNNVPGVPVTGRLSTVAMSAIGDKLVAVAPTASAIYTSTNFGTTWVSNNVPAEPWVSIASSADGTKLVALGGRSIGIGPIYVSADSGQTWQPANAPITNWVSVASSANGSNWVAATAVNPSIGSIYTSTDCGLDWTLMTGAPNLFWESVASSADGTKLLAASGNGFIYTSTNSGATWLSNNVPEEQWIQVACSANGNTLVAVYPLGEIYGENTGYIYMSTNSGLNWFAYDRTPIQSWWGIASSADGGTLVASGQTSFISSGGSIYILQTFPAPELNIAPSSSNLALSWLIPSTNFVVQQSPDLISWSSVTDAPALDFTNLNYELSLSPTNSSGFFRLMSQ